MVFLCILNLSREAGNGCDPQRQQERLTLDVLKNFQALGSLTHFFECLEEVARGQAARKQGGDKGLLFISCSSWANLTDIHDW